MHLIWDFNGTLLDDTGLCLELFNDQLAGLGKPSLSRKDYRDLFDFPIEAVYKKSGFDFSIRSYAAIALEFNRAYAGRIGECALHPDIAATLDHFYQSGVEQSVLSAYEQSALEAALTAFGIHHFFAHIVGLSNVHAAGKEAEGRLLIRRIGLPPRELTLIGDTTHDYNVASALGIRCILIAAGHQSRNKLSRCPCPILDSVRALPALIDR